MVKNLTVVKVCAFEDTVFEASVKHKYSHTHSHSVTFWNEGHFSSALLQWANGQ